MKTYKILWIDDKPELSSGFRQLAKKHGLTLLEYKTHKEGMEVLKKDISSYDGVILDALGHYESADESEELYGLNKSLHMLASLSSIKKIPHCIYSAEINKSGYDAQKKLFRDIVIFDKAGSAPTLDMIEYIKSEADKQHDTQVRHEHAALFKILEDYSEENKKTVLNIIRSLRFQRIALDDNLYFTPLRKILETMFRKANEIGLLHDACVSKNGSQVNLTESSFFLSGGNCNSTNVRCAKTHFPKVISKAVKQILELTGAASHTTNVDITKNIDVQELRTYVRTPYLLYSILFMLSDVLIWFDNYCQENKDVAVNKSYWENTYDPITNGDTVGSEEELSGEIIKIENGWGTFKIDTSGKTLSVRPSDVTKYNIGRGEKFSVTTKPSPDGTKTYIDKILLR